MTEYKNLQYGTPVYYTPADAWEDLGIWMREKIPQNHLVLFRDVPQVDCDYAYDEKKNHYRGWVRFCFDPNKALDGNYMHIPTLGSSQIGPQSPQDAR